MKRTLILACSATKNTVPGRLPALHRYDGPAWRTLRANVSPVEILHGYAELAVYALSAEHGLIAAETWIADYDRRMTPARAKELEPIVGRQLRELKLAGEIFVYGGADYRRAIGGACAYADGLPLLERMTFTRGGIGDQLGQLKAWLRRKA